jgi:hypothetical protein
MNNPIALAWKGNHYIADIGIFIGINFYKLKMLSNIELILRLVLRSIRNC